MEQTSSKTLAPRILFLSSLSLQFEQGRSEADAAPRLSRRCVYHAKVLILATFDRIYSCLCANPALGVFFPFHLSAAGLSAEEHATERPRRVQPHAALSIIYPST
jgi:hypothetical protein